MRCVAIKIAVIYVTFLSEEKHGLVVDTFRAEIEKRDKKIFYEKKYLRHFTSLWAGGDSGQKFATGENWTGFNWLISWPRPGGLSSAMSRAANSRLAELELAGSSVRFRFISKVLRVWEWPGLLIRNSQGIQLRNSHRIYTAENPLNFLSNSSGSYPVWHAVGLWLPVMEVEDHDGGHHTAGHHEHDAVEVGS